MDTAFFEFMAVGFVAQLADGALGMGFGLISSSVLLISGAAPPLVSSAVNAAKIPTGAAAGLSHLMSGNIDRAVFLRIALAGTLGGLAGALLLSALKGPWLMGLVAVYLIVISSLIILRALRGRAVLAVPGRKASLIGACGGLIEGIGGSWGPVVTTGLLGAGMEPRRAVGSSALAELCVSVAVFSALMLTAHLGLWGDGDGIGTMLWPVLGLICGGLPAALLGGPLARMVPRRPLTLAVGLMALGVGIQRGAQLLF